jgi:uncharacterized SAM-dependent methyltransferase
VSPSELVVALERARRRTEDLLEPLCSKFRRKRLELEARQAGLRVESWWTDRAGDFAVALVFRDAAAGS